MTTTPEEAFALDAHPHAWLLVADDLHAQAILSRKGRGGSLLIQRDGQGREVGRWDHTDRAAFLLGGFALENVVKAFLVYENPQWVSNGRLSRLLRSHKLTELAQQSHLIPHKSRSAKLLRRFEDGLESWARYPCALDAETTRTRPTIGEKLWLEYERLMPAYGRKLAALLSIGWRGPHGVDGRVTFQGLLPLEKEQE